MMNIFGEVHSTCRRAAEVAADVRIDRGRLAELAATLSATDVAASALKSDAGGHLTPYRASSTTEQVNFAVTFSLLQMGHGFRHALHALLGLGASATVTAGLEHLVAEQSLDAKSLASITSADIERHFRVPHAGAVALLHEQLLQLLTESGTILQARGCAHWADFLAETQQQGRSAAHFVRGLVETFPGFADRATLADGTTVWLAKKAVLAAAEVARQLGERGDPAPFTDIDSLPPIVDNVVPAMLVKHGVVLLSERLTAVIQSDQPLPPGPLEAELRAVSLHACDLIVEARKGAFTGAQVAYYLWLLVRGSAARGSVVCWRSHAALTRAGKGW